jgi:heavy metal translocating P-type ATPase
MGYGGVTIPTAKGGVKENFPLTSPKPKATVLSLIAKELERMATRHGGTGERNTSPPERPVTRLWLSIGFTVPLVILSIEPLTAQYLPFTVLGKLGLLPFALIQSAVFAPILLANRTAFKRVKSGLSAIVSVGAAVAAGSGSLSAALIAIGTAIDSRNLMQVSSGGLLYGPAALILTSAAIATHIESRAQNRATDAIGKLLRLWPETVVAIRGEVATDLPIGEISIGEILELKPGDIVPVDGVVTLGLSRVDTSALTGESLPMLVYPGKQITSAAINIDSPIRVRADRTGNDTTLAGVERMVRRAWETKPQKPGYADRIGRILLPIALTLAVATIPFCLVMGHSTVMAAIAGIAVLVLLCPCALALSSPLASLCGTAAGVRSGVLVKSAWSLERMKSVDTVVVDKTGALTEAKPAVTDIIRMSDMDDNELLSLAATIQTRSEFPLAQAIVAEAAKSGLPIGEVESFAFHPGKGVEATIKGKRYFSGGPELLMENGIDVRSVLGRIMPLTAQGKTPFSFGCDGKMLGIVVVADAVKPSSRAAIATMKEMGLDVIMLTADNHPTARGIGEALGIRRFYAGLLPGNKAEIIRGIKREGRTVMMVGDGLNDAPAFAEADVGVAIGTGTDIAIESADIVLINGDLRDAASGIALGRAVSRITRQNLVLSVAIDAIAIPLTSGALFSTITPSLNPSSIPALAVCAMAAGLAAVALNACRLSLFRRG